jgi:PAS domain S-box-containing protein
MDSIFREQLKLLFRLYPLILLGGHVVMWGVLFVFREQTIWAWLWYWAALVEVILVVFLGLLAWRYTRTKESCSRYWYTAYLSGITALAACWGLLGLCFPMLEGLVAQWFLLILISGMAVGGLMTVIPVLPVAWLFIILVLSPVSFLLWQSSQPVHHVLGLMGFALLAGLMVLSLWFNQFLLNYLQLNFQNGLRIASLKKRIKTYYRDLQSVHQRNNQEMSRRVALEKQLCAAEADVSAVMASMKETFYRINERGEVLRISPSIRELLGYTPSKTEKCRFSGLFNDEKTYRQFVYAVKTEALADYAVCFRHRNGSMVSVLLSGHFWQDKDGENSFIEGTIRQAHSVDFGD